MRTVFFLPLMFASVSAFAQIPNLDHLMTQRLLRCDEISFNCSLLIPRYYRENKMDSVSLVVAYWNEKCPGTEVATRMEILDDLKNEKFSEALYGEDLYYILDSYRSYKEFTYEPATDSVGRMLAAAHNAFDLFTQNVATEIRADYPEGSLEYLICDVYASGNFESLYKVLQTGRYRDAGIKKAYDRDVRTADKLIDVTFSAFAGIWIPQQNLRYLGPHPLAGFSGGAIRKRFSLQGTIACSFMESKNFYVLFDDERVRHETDHFFATQLGVEGYYDLSRQAASSMPFVSAGFGYDIITAKEGDEERGIEAVDMGSFSATIGVGYKIFVDKNRSRFISMQGRYHFVDFDTRGGTDLSGDAVSFRLSFGGMSLSRRDRLAYLHHPGR